MKQIKKSHKLILGLSVLKLENFKHPYQAQTTLNLGLQPKVTSGKTIYSLIIIIYDA